MSDRTLASVLIPGHLFLPNALTNQALCSEGLFDSELDSATEFLSWNVDVLL